MSAMRDIVSALISSGMDAVDAAALLAAAVVEASPRTRSPGAERALRYRENRALRNVTKRDEVTPDDTVTKRDESVTNRDTVTTTTISKEKSSSRKRAASRTSLPADFALTEAMTVYAVSKTINPIRVPLQFEKFCNYHRSKGSIFADWAAAWRTWVSNAVEFDKNAPQGPQGGFKWNGIEGVI